MVEVDGVKYISEKEFDNAVLSEFRDLAKAIVDSAFEDKDVLKGEAVIHAIILGKEIGGTVTDFVRNLRIELFGAAPKRSDLEGHEDE